MAQNYKQWDVEAVSQWLESIHLHTLIPTFERNNISGIDLPQLDDAYLRDHLRITKPAELAALRGALHTLTAYEPAARQANKPLPKRSVTAPTRERSGSLDKPPKKPPATIPRNFTVGEGDFVPTREPQLKKGASAPDVLDDRCRYSGWIRKQGGGYKNWRKRYLVLRLGCLYYFANETAKEAKGCFTLAGYRTEICQDPEILKKWKWTLKVEPANGALRTYYLSVGAKRELYAWKQAIDEEIAACAKRPRFDDRGGVGVQPSAQTVVTEVVEGSSDEEGDDEEPIYDEPEGDEDFNEDGQSPIYDDPADGEEDDPYTHIREDGIVAACMPSSSTLSPPAHHGKVGPMAVKSFKSINDWELAPEHRVLGRGGAPTVPMRSPISLGLNERQAPPPPMHGRDGIMEDTYLPIIGSGPSESTPLTVDRKMSAPPSLHPITTIAEPPRTIPTVIDKDYEDDSALEGDDMYDPYYIMVRKPEELMPPSCLFDNLDRSEVDRLLRGTGRDGTYLIRAGSHAGADKVLSVWHLDRCRHYKLFKDENSRYSLTQGQTFGTIPELLQHYSQGAHLPRSEDLYLTDPFYPS